MARTKNPNYGVNEEVEEEENSNSTSHTVSEEVEEEENSTSHVVSEEGAVEEEENSTSHTVSNADDNSGSDEEVGAMKPLRMYFPPTEYKKTKLSTRCYLHEALQTLLTDLQPPLTQRERNWFENHPQFKHIFHMPRDPNHKLMGMWMLLLRTACIEKEKEVWFIVNGVPIRYGLREHALISGLYCHNYPLGYDNPKSGAMAFVERYFKRGSTIRYQDLKPMLESMEPPANSDDRLRMAILYFLASIIKAQTKTGPNATSVDPLLLRAVSDLNLCKTFPWGRLTYDHMLEGISNTLKHFNGVVPEGKKLPPWPIPGFCIPLELLAFEAIPQLRISFREPFPGANENCPKMCKHTFKKSMMRGFPFEKINAELGTTKDIDTILIASPAETKLLNRITEKNDDDDKHCVVVESWMERHRQGHAIFFQDMFEEDVASRLVEAPLNAVNPEIPLIEPQPNTSMPFSELVDLVKSMKEGMEERMTRMENKVDELDKRVTPVEAYVQEKLAERRMFEENIFYDNHDLGHVEKEGEEHSEDGPTERVVEGGVTEKVYVEQASEDDHDGRGRDDQVNFILVEEEHLDPIVEESPEKHLSEEECQEPTVKAAIAAEVPKKKKRKVVVAAEASKKKKKKAVVEAEASKKKERKAAVHQKAGVQKRQRTEVESPPEVDEDGSGRPITRSRKLKDL